MANARTARSAASFTDAIQPRTPRNATDPDPGGDSELGGAGGAGDVEPLDAAIARVLAELGGDAEASINVYAIRPGARSGEFVDSFPADAFAGEASFLKRIRDEFGPGEYRIQLRDGTKFLVNRLVRIAPARERARGDEPAGVVAAVAAVLAEHTKRTEDLIRALAAARQPESEDVVLARLKAMREIFGPIGGGGARSGADSIEHFLRGLTLGRSLEPSTGAGTTDVLLETVKTLGPALVRAVQQQGKLAAPAKRTVPPGPAPTAGGASSSTSAAVAAPGDNAAMTPAIRKLLEQLIDAAARDADPELYAELVLDQVGPDELRQVAGMGDPAALLASLDPRVHQHMDWFVELRTALEALLADETPDPINGAAAGTGGSDDNAADHARDGT